MPLHFIADVHLGRLARALRMLGFDTIYRNDFGKQELIELAALQNRIVLSKDPFFERKFKSGSFTRIISDNWKDQLQQVISSHNLQNEIAPFSRCMVCNGILLPVQKDEIAAQLEANTRQSYETFWQCETCKRLYWKGPHYHRMMIFIQQLTTNTRIQ